MSRTAVMARYAPFWADQLGEAVIIVALVALAALATHHAVRAWLTSTLKEL